MAFRRHIPALERAIAHSDVLLCVFDAENPKRRDHADFLAPFVERFDGESVLALLNKCDRLDEGEVKASILPDFLDYLRDGWRGKVDQVLCICARRHLHEPGWDPSASPRHGFDQFEELRGLVAGRLNRGSLVIDRRVDNARQLHAVVLSEAGRELSADRAGAGWPATSALPRRRPWCRRLRAARTGLLRGAGWGSCGLQAVHPLGQSGDGCWRYGRA
jgi:hypothetical protein